MPLLSKNSRFVLFIHIPKTGGSYIEQVAKRCGWKIQLIVNGLNPVNIDFLKITPQHFHADLFESFLDLSGQVETFTIVRHPFNRFKSEYYWQLSLGMTEKDPESWMHDIFAEYQTDKSICDNHIRPQTEFLPTTADCRILKLEEGGMDAAEELLFGESRNNVKHRIVRNLQKRKAKVSKYDPSIEERFSLIRSEIEDFYDRDMKHFKYSKKLRPT